MQEKRVPSFLSSVLVFSGIIGILIVGIMAFKLDIHVLLILGLILSCVVAIKTGFSLDELMNGMAESVKKAMVAMLIFILIGMIIGSWITAGTVPALIYYGLKFLSPKFFLPAGFIVCSITSFATGTSWGTAATVGLAMMGMGVGLGIPAPAVAGMVVSGAIFGDKMSPMSDTTVLAAASADCDMYDHIKAMCYTTIPAFILSLIGYTMIGFHFTNSSTLDSSQTDLIQSTLSSTFNLNPIILLPIVVVLVLSFLKVPSVPSLLLGVFLGTLCAVIFQGASIQSAFAALNYGYTQTSGIELIDSLLIRGGIQKMMWTFSLAFIALCLGGVLETAGFLTVLIEKVLTRIKSAAGLVTLTMLTSILGNAATSEVYLSIILNGNLYREAYDKKGLKRSMLSRVLEEGATLTGIMWPWTTCGAFMAATLGVSTLEFAPYTLLAIINPLLSIILAWFGIFVFRKSSNEVEKSVAE